MSNGSGADTRHSVAIVPLAYNPGHLAKLSLTCLGDFSVGCSCSLSFRDQDKTASPELF
jgi:hypothetical protein